MTSIIIWNWYLVLFSRDKKFFLSKDISFSSKSSAKFGKLSVGKHSKLKSDFSAIKLSLFSLFKSNLISELDIVAINLEDYEEYKLKPEKNLKLRVGLEREFKNINLLLFADYYKNNLIGFESITFNRRTESYFDKPYGELGLSLKVKF